MPALHLPHHSSHHGQSHSREAPKARTTCGAKTVVANPLFKKLNGTYSERSSLDLDRTWEEQDPNSGAAPFDYDLATARRMGAESSCSLSSRDVSSNFSAPSWAPAAAVDLPASMRSVSQYSHTRSASGASGGSAATVATTGTSTGVRGGSFVHPFQQTPRTSTPPLSYTRSYASLDAAAGGLTHYPSAATIDEDAVAGDYDDVESTFTLPTPSSSTNNTNTASGTAATTPAISDAGRTSYSFPRQKSDLASEVSPKRLAVPKGISRQHQQHHPQPIAGSATHPVVGQTQNLMSPISSSPTPSSSSSSASSAAEDPSSTPVLSRSFTMATTSPTYSSSTCVLRQLGSGSSSTSAQANNTTSAGIAPLRSSLDMSNFRLRARSELDTATRQEHIRLARRKFEEKQRVKEEKYAREQVRKRERADTKEAQRSEKSAAQAHKRRASASKSFDQASRPSTSSLRKTHRLSRQSHQHDHQQEHQRNGGKHYDVENTAEAAAVLAARSYEDAAQGQQPQPRADDVHFDVPRRHNTARHRTSGAWTVFSLWLRTRLVNLGR